MKEALLTILRNKETKTAEFRSVTNKLAQLIAADAALFVPLNNTTVQTPLAASPGKALEATVVLVPILRSGLVLLFPFMNIFPEAITGFIGIRRDEETAEPVQYYEHLPTLTGEEEVFLLDPMIGTGGSIAHTLRRLIYNGAKQKKIRLFGIIASKPGIEKLHREFPDVQVHVVGIDEELNVAHFIVPGLGDFGDRYFST